MDALAAIKSLTCYLPSVDLSTHRGSLVIPPEPPVADWILAATAHSRQGRAALGAAKLYPCRRAPLWHRPLARRAVRWDHEVIVNPAGGLRA